MRIIETRTAQGSGFWGYETYEIELKTRLTTYARSDGTNEKTISGYQLGFRGAAQSDLRSFASDQKRREFIAKHFTQLKLKEIPKAEQKSTSVACPLADIVGKYLSSVTFVMDYLQVDFCGSHFSFYNWPIVNLRDRKVEMGEPEYRNELCTLIGKTVKSVDVLLDSGLTFEFQSGEGMTVSLRAPAGSTLPEVAEYSRSQGSGIIWTSGEEPFD
jgi:hypothetical protein